MKYFKNEQLKVKNIIKENRNFLLLGHLDPDGDALGAIFGMAYILKKMKKTPIIGLNQPLPKKYEMFNLDDSIKIVFPEKININRIDTIIVFDAGGLNRLDKYKEIVEKKVEDINVINIDHHQSNEKFGNLNIVDSDACSASQMIIELLGSRVLDKKSAYCIYSGIVYDTGSFRHGTNLKRAHESAVVCLNYGIDTKYVYDQLFALETEQSLKLFSRALTRLHVIEKSKIAYMSLDFDAYKELKSTPEDSAGFINRMGMLEGAQLVLFFNEKEKNVVKISLRSNSEFDVGEFAAKFGGGGHAKASGCMIEGILDKVIDRVLRSLKLAIDSSNSTTK